MIGRRKGVGAGWAVLLAAGLAACAPQQQQTRPAATPAAGAHAAQNASWWSGLAESLARNDHSRAMAHCAEMRQQVRQGGQVPPDMQRMQRTCDHMDHSMGRMRGRPPG
ncbi:hypothetical protein GCM10009416_33440 [Craurococcus roseus]|uniref:Uncharacterized protein n=1 Tax=Craurococcus roseus TaxID=77585 RepID=A0ABP3QK94_9PROT